jgi:hypothetical protein
LRTCPAAIHGTPRRPKERLASGGQGQR